MRRLNTFNSARKLKMSKSQFERSTIASPFFGGKQASGTISQDSGRTNPDSSRGPSGGYIPAGTVRQNGGSLLRSPKVADSVNR
jgi:hypothetical protein